MLEAAVLALWEEMPSETSVNGDGTEWFRNAMSRDIYVFMKNIFKYIYVFIYTCNQKYCFLL